MGAIAKRIASRPTGLAATTAIVRAAPRPPQIVMKGPPKVITKRGMATIANSRIATSVASRAIPRPKRGAGDLGNPFNPSPSGGSVDASPPQPAEAQQERYIQPDGAPAAPPPSTNPEDEEARSSQSDEEYEEEDEGYDGERDEGESVEEANSNGAPQVAEPPIATQTPKGLFRRIWDFFFAGELDDDLQVPLASSHVLNGVMHTAALTVTPKGCHTVVTRVGCPRADQEGIVNFNGENPEWVDNAIGRTKKALAIKAKTEIPKKELGSLVRRARVGDQNAMGIIAMVRARAQAGDARAKRSARYLYDYIRNNPPTGDMGNELDSPLGDEIDSLRAVIVFANGAPLGNSRIRELQSQFGNESHRKLFTYGIIRPRPVKEERALIKRLDPVSKSVLDAARIIGKARAIQMVRLPNSSLTRFSPVIGWELGE